MTLYVASKVRHAPMWRQLRVELANLGIRINSTWIDEDEEGVSYFPDLSDRCIREVLNADVFLLYCKPGEVLKGAFIEAGVRLGAGMVVRSVGQCQNWPRVFAEHRLWVSFDSISKALELENYDLSRFV